MNARNFAAANSKNGTVKGKPLKIPRPYSKAQTKRKATPADLLEIFGGDVTYSAPE